MKSFLCALMLPGLCLAAMLPETIGPYQRGPISPPAIKDAPLWQEYGLKASETAGYQNGKAKFTATIYQLPDTTSSMAVFDWLRPADAHSSAAAKLAAENKDTLVLAYGNYVLSFAGYKPSQPELEAVTSALLNVDNTVLPILPGYLPSQGLVPESERYVIGTVGLQKFYPGIPPSVAAFHMGAEAQVGVFHNQKGDVAMAIFNYPTNQIAQVQTPLFEKLPGVVAKRSGPLVAVVLNPPDPDYAETLLSQIRYQAQITLDEHVPTRRDNIGDLIINAFILIGILVGFSIVSGFALGGVRLLIKRLRHGEEPDAMITLDLDRP